MATTDFTSTILIDQTSTEVLNVINNVRGWWSGEITGSADKLNDEFTYRYKDLHMSKQRIVEIIPDRKVVWLVIESQINYVEDKREWTNTGYNWL